MVLGEDGEQLLVLGLLLMAGPWSLLAEKGESFSEHSAAAAANHVSRAQPSMGKGRETLVTCRHQSSLLKDYRRMHSFLLELKM